MVRINIDDDALAEFCQRHRIKRLAFFGSVLRDDFGPDSDVDVLVQFEPGASVGFFAIARMQGELTTLLGRPVDSRTPKGLSRYFRDRVVREAERHMWPENDVTRLHHMLDAALDAIELAGGLSEEQLGQERTVSLAVVRLLEVVGEAASRMSTETRRELPDVPWNVSIIGMRNQVIHAYMDVDLAIVADTVRDDLPALVGALRGKATGLDEARAGAAARASRHACCAARRDSL